MDNLEAKMSIQGLKQLLEIAKELDKSFQADRRSKELWKLTNSAWRTIHIVIGNNTPLVMIAEDGERLMVGTAGVLTSDVMMFYSTKTKAKYCMTGHNLKAIVDFDYDYIEAH